MLVFVLLFIKTTQAVFLGLKALIKTAWERKEAGRNAEFGVFTKRQRMKDHRCLKPSEWLLLMMTENKSDCKHD